MDSPPVGRKGIMSTYIYGDDSSDTDSLRSDKTPLLRRTKSSRVSMVSMSADTTPADQGDGAVPYYDFDWWNVRGGCRPRGVTHSLHAGFARATIAWFNLVSRNRMTTIVAAMSLFGVMVYGMQWSAFSTEPDVDFLTAWLTPKSWRQQNRASHENNWGAQHLEQVIITPSTGNSFMPADGDRSALLAAYDLVQQLKALTVDVNEEQVSMDTVCYKPAAPLFDGCLLYNPFVWWDNDRGRVATDNTTAVLGAITAATDLPGLVIKREDVFGGVIESAPGEVEFFGAIMVWFFVDIDKTRLIRANYNESVAGWEDGLLNMSLAYNRDPGVPLDVACAISNSKNDEISKAVLADLVWIYGAIAAIFVLLGLMLFALHPAHGKLAAGLVMTLGAAVMAQIGLIGWAVELDLIIKFNGDLMLAFLPMTIGAHQRLLMLRAYRFAVAQTGSVNVACADIAANSLCPYFLLCNVYAWALLTSLVWIETPALVAYTVAAVAGLLCDVVAMATFGIVAITAAGAQDKNTRSDDTPLLINYPTPPMSAPNPKTKALMQSYDDLTSIQTLEIYSLFPKSVRLGWWLISVIILASTLVVTARQLLGSWSPELPLHALVPESSYIYPWSVRYDEFFADTAMPIDFPMNGIDYGEPANGPYLMQIGNELRDHPLINGSTFMHWYAAYTAYCTAGALCAETMVDGYPTNQSFTSFYLVGFLSSEDYQSNAACLKLDGVEWTHRAMFRGETVNGALRTYSDQLTLPSTFHELTEEIVGRVAGQVTSQAGGLGGFEVYAYAAAFPYFETWQPARDDLWNLALIMLSASAVLGLMTLEVWIMVGSALSVVAGVGGVFYFCFVGLNGDLNLVTAVGVYLLLVMLVGTSFNATWRYAGLVGASAPGDDPTATFVQGSIGRVFVPATFAYAFVLGCGALVFLGCGSPINIQFFYLFEAILGISCGVFFLVVIPWIDVYPLLADVFCGPNACKGQRAYRA